MHGNNKDYEAHLRNSFLDGVNYYPMSLADARAVLDNRMSTISTVNHQQQQRSENNYTSNATGVDYNNTTTTHGSSTDSISEMSSSHQSGGNNTNGSSQPHIENDCSPSRSSNSHVSFGSSSQATIPRTWILLDNQLSVDIISNPALVTIIKTSKHLITITSHAGSKMIHQEATLPGYGRVWFDPTGPANILSLYNLHEDYTASYDSQETNIFRLHHRQSGREFEFHPSSQGLYYLD